MEAMTGLDWKSAPSPTVIRRFHKGTGKAPNGTGGVIFFRSLIGGTTVLPSRGCGGKTCARAHFGLPPRASRLHLVSHL